MLRLKNSTIEEKVVYSRALQRVIPVNFDLDIVSLKDPPTMEEEFDLVKEKLFYLINSLSENKATLFTPKQQKILLEQVESLVITPPYVLFNNKERGQVWEDHKQTLIEVYEVISKPREQFNAFQEKIEQTKKQAGKDRLVGILSVISGVIGFVLSIAAIPVIGVASVAPLTASQ